MARNGLKATRYHLTALGLILLVFISLATLYSVMVPLTQGEDELAHYRYISFIAETGRLPVNREERKQAWYRADWPPLYHLLVGWAIDPLDTTKPRLKDVGELAHRRLVGEIFYPRLIIYTEDVNWPWQDGILAWHVGRFISILFSAAALIFTYLTVLELIKSKVNHKSSSQNLASPSSNDQSPITQQFIPLITTALLAFIPRYLFTSSMLGDDSLFILLSAIFIWLLLRAVRGDDRWWMYGLMGLLLGLSIATKYSTGLLPLAIIPVVWWQARQKSWPWHHSLGRLGVSWLATLVGASWWFGWIGYHFNTIRRDGLFFGLVSPLLNSGPDVSMRRIFAFFTGEAFTGQERPDAIEAGTFWEWLVYLFQTFWGVPVLEVDPLFPWIYLVMFLLSVLALIGLWQLWPTADGQIRMSLAVLAFVVLLLLPFPILRFYLTKNVLETGQGRHILYPAAQSIPILLVFGWATFITRFRPNNVRFLLLVPGFLLFWSLFQFVYMSRTYPNPLPVQTTTFKQASIPQPLAPENFGPSIALLGYDLQPASDQSILNLTLFWQALATVDENYRVRVEFIDANQETRLTWLSHPLNGKYPTRAWDEDDVIRDGLAIPVAGLPAGSYRLQLNLLREAEDSPLRAAPYQLTEFKLDQFQALLTSDRLGNLNYRLWLDDQPVRYRQTLPISWIRPDEPANPDDTPTLSLVGPDGVPRRPSATSAQTGIFIVGADWPSGDYRLQLEQNSEIINSETLLTVANDLRTFELPPLPEGYTPVEANFADQVKLRGYTLPTRRLEAGGGLPITLYWQSLAPVLGDYVIFDVLLDEKQQVYGGYDRLPREFYSTILWAEAEVVEDGFGIPIKADAPPGVYHLHLGLYALKNGEPVSLPLMHEGRPSDITSVVIGPLKVGGPPQDVVTTNPTPQVPLAQSFNGRISLLGYDLAQTESSLKVTLYWRSDAPQPIDYTTFLHLRDQTNMPVAQKDSPPAAGRYPTSLWDPGEIIVDEIIVPIDHLSPGDYSLVTGLYDPLSGDRLPTEGVPENEIRLKSVTVPPP